MMRYLFIIAALAIASCSSDTEQSTLPASDTTAQSDSLKKQEESDEMTKEVIEGSFDALNR